MTKEEKLRIRVRYILENENESIRKYVAQEALGYYSITTFFHDVLHYGCKNGTITSLVYYYQTHEFFDRFYDDIEAIRIEYEQSTGVHIQLLHDLKNTLAWFAFEQTVYQIAGEIGLEP